MTYRILLFIMCILATLPAHAERYSSGGEALFVGALQGVFLMLVSWVWRLIRGSKSKTRETHHQDVNNTIPKHNTENTISKLAQPSLSPWEKYKMNNTETAKAAESLIEGNLQYLSEKDIFEKIATFKRMSQRFDCPISELKNVTVNIFVSKFNSEELLDVVDRLTSKSKLESRGYSISEENTMAYYAQQWLSDYLYNTINIK
ncbi:MAG: hypothetical protein K2G11_07260 [Muribaculaceae bacterium]|nr:hypothetical protein [Muribaculaceae bacterium]